MNRSPQQCDRQQSPFGGLFLRLILPQIAMTAGLAIWALFDGGEFALSLLLGALVFTIPYGWFVWYSYLTSKMQAGPDKKTRRLYSGEMQKFILTAVLFGVVFVRVPQLVASAFFAAFVAEILLSWVTSAWLASRKDRV